MSSLPRLLRLMLGAGAVFVLGASSACTKVECHSGDSRCNGAAVDTCDTYANCGDSGFDCDSVWSEDACGGPTPSCLEQKNASGAVVAACVPNGTSTTCEAAPISGAPSGNVVVGDVDGDGDVDLVVFGGGKLQALLRGADGSFAAGPISTVTSWSSAQAMVTGDFDGDGTLDVAALTYDTSSESGVGQISVAKGTGGGTFAAPAPFSSSNVQATYGPIVVADFDEDGAFDILVGSTLLLAHDSSSTGRSVDWGSACDACVAKASVDFDGDHHADVVVVGGGNVGVAFGDGKGSFAPAVQILGDSHVLANVGDFDGDSHPDVVAVDTSDQVSVVLGHGDRTFGAPVAAGNPMAIGSGELFPVDIDSDGRDDLLFGNGTTLGEALATGGGALAAPSYFAPKVASIGQVDLEAALVMKNPARVEAVVVSGAQVEMIDGVCR